MQENTNPTDPPYQSKVYKALKENLQGFDRTEEGFRLSLKDRNYQSKVYKALKDNLEGFDKSEEEFYSLVSDAPQKKKPNQSGDSNVDNGFSGFPKSKYGIGAVLEEANNPVSKRPDAPQKQKSNTFVEATKEPNVFKNEYKTIDGEIKTLKPTTPLTKGEQAIELARKAKSKVDLNLSLEKLQQEKEQTGVLNRLGQAGKALLS